MNIRVKNTIEWDFFIPGKSAFRKFSVYIRKQTTIIAKVSRYVVKYLITKSNVGFFQKKNLKPILHVKQDEIKLFKPDNYT